MSINWDMPLQWNDGIEAWTVEVISDEYRVLSSTEQTRDWVGRMPSEVGVDGDGTVNGQRRARIQNWDMPPLKTEMGEMIVEGHFLPGALRVALKTANADSYSIYKWPQLTPVSGAPKLIEMDIREIEKAERIAEDLERLVSSDDSGIYGSF